MTNPVRARLRVTARADLRRPDYESGADVIWFCDFEDGITGVPVAASDVTFVVTLPDLSLLSPAPTPSLVAGTVSTWQVLIPSAAMIGDWYVQASCSNAGAVPDVRAFTVVDSTPAAASGDSAPAVKAVNGKGGPFPVLGVNDLDGVAEAVDAAATDAGAAAGEEAGALAGSTSGAQAGVAAAGPLAEAAEASADAAAAARDATLAAVAGIDDAVDAAAASRAAAEAAQAGAVTAQGLAETARGAAQVAAAEADVSRASAAASATSAGLSATAALTAAPIYADTTAGLAAVAEGATFSVVGSGADFAILFRKVGGAAVELQRYPSSAAVQAIPARIAETPISDLLAAVKIGARVVAGIRDSGRQWFAAGMSWTLASGKATWARLSGGQRVELDDADGLRTNGPFGFIGGAGWRDEGGALGFRHEVRGKTFFRYGEREFASAGMLVTYGVDGSWSIRDPYGALVSVSAAGVATYRGVTAPVATTAPAALPGAVLSIAGSDGRSAVFGINSAGYLRLIGATSSDDGDITAAEIAAYDAQAQAYSASVLRRDVSAYAIPNAQVVLYIGTGQSLMAGLEAWPTLSRDGARYDNLMLGGSVHSFYRTTPLFATMDGTLAFSPMVARTRQTGEDTGLIPYTDEPALIPGATRPGETPLEGALAVLRDRWLRRRGIVSGGDLSRRFGAQNVAVGGSTVQMWLPETAGSLHPRFTGAIAASKAACDAAGLTFAVGGILRNQGQQDYDNSINTSRPTYAARMTAEIAAQRAGVQAITGQANVPVFAKIPGGPYTRDSQELAIAMAHLDVAASVPGVFNVGCDQRYPNKAGGHLTSNGSRWSGAQFGHVMARVQIDGQGWEAMRMLAAYWRGRDIVVTWHTPVRGVQIGTTYNDLTPVTLASGGARIFDSAGEISVSAAQIVAGQVTRWRANRAISGTVKIWLGRKTEHEGAICFCDSDASRMVDRYEYAAGSGQYPEENITDLVGLAYDPRNFAVPQVITATAL